MLFRSGEGEGGVGGVFHGEVGGEVVEGAWERRLEGGSTGVGQGLG